MTAPFPPDFPDPDGLEPDELEPAEPEALEPELDEVDPDEDDSDEDDEEPEPFVPEESLLAADEASEVASAFFLAPSDDPSGEDSAARESLR